jgi:hypothetical protein
LALAGPGLFIAGVAAHGSPAWQDRLAMYGDQDAALTVGLVVTALGVAVGALLIFVGRWLCLMYAPPSNGSKELMLCCVVASVSGPLLLVAAHFLGGARNYVLFREGLDAFDMQAFLQSAGAVQAGGLAVIGLSTLLFSGFVSRVALYFKDPARAGRADWYRVLVFFLLGGLAGTFFCPSSTRPTILLGLAAGAVVSLLWNVVLLADARRGVLAALAARDAKEAGAARPRGAYDQPYSASRLVYRLPNP